MDGKQSLSWIREHSCFDFISEGPSSQRESHEEFLRRCAFITSEREREGAFSLKYSSSSFIFYHIREREEHLYLGKTSTGKNVFFRALPNQGGGGLLVVALFNRIIAI